MGKILNFLIIFINIKIFLSIPTCKEGDKNCIQCHPLTNLCVKCNKNIYIPDENGGCEYSKKCVMGNNYCLKCNEKEDLCLTCENGYHPDGNGGCSYSSNCQVSYKGECLVCKDNAILIGNDQLKICKSLDLDDFLNCEEINTEKGICNLCKEGYFLNSGDKKCIKTENCTESIFGVCQKCNSGYYLNKKQNECLLKNEDFVNCMETLDGKTCDICEEGYFFDSENNYCVKTKFCEKGDKNGNCHKCTSGYYLTKYDKSCTNEKNCYFGYSEFGVCELCIDGYYMDFSDGKCKSYDNEDKYCRKSENGICYECISPYHLAEDNKCSTSKNCEEADNGICIQCSEEYHLGSDNICTNVEHCIYTDLFFDKCKECEDNYYYDNLMGICNPATDEFENCKNGNKDTYCYECKNDFYFDRKQSLCLSNKVKGKFYKCALTDINSKFCVRCVDDYFLSYKNNLCISTDGCNIAEDGNRCLECNEYHCLDLKTGKCEINQYIEKEEQKIYYRCNQTNEEGTSCEICNNGFNLNEDGLCINEDACAEKNKDETCKKCINDENNSYCLNEIFGCVEIYDENCLECNDFLNLEKCSKCKEGYKIDEDGKCIHLE